MNNNRLLNILNSVANFVYILCLLIAIYVGINIIYALTYNNIIADLVTAFLVILVLIIVSYKNKINLFKFKQFTFCQKYSFLLICIVAALLLQFLSLEISKIVPSEFYKFYNLAYGSGGSGLVKSDTNFIIVDSLILAPVLEEFVFRFILFNSVKNRFKNRYFIFFISSFSFGLFHVLSFINGNNFYALITNYVFWIYFLIKILFGYYFVFIYDKTKNIFINIFFHFISNLITTFM